MHIQNLILPCELRGELTETSDARSDGDETEAQTLCQKSEVAICVPRASKVQNEQLESGGTSSVERTREQNAGAELGAAVVVLEAHKCKKVALPSREPPP